MADYSDADIEGYMRVMLAHEAYRAWREAALVETWVVAKVEVDEQPVEILRKPRPSQ